MNYAVHAWHYSIHVWLLGWFCCSSPSTKELRAQSLSWIYPRFKFRTFSFELNLPSPFIPNAAFVRRVLCRVKLARISRWKLYFLRHWPSCTKCHFHVVDFVFLSCLPFHWDFTCIWCQNYYHYLLKPCSEICSRNPKSFANKLTKSYLSTSKITLFCVRNVAK